MSLDPLNAISPVDGRYRNQTGSLAPYFSEEALMRYRVRVEIEYFISLCELPLPQLKGVKKQIYPSLRDIYIKFNSAAAVKIKQIEKTTNHDVKAVEYYIKDQMKKLGLEKELEFVHFGLTSQDINNTAVPLSIKESLEEIIYPLLDRVVSTLRSLSKEWASVSMLARTHGQPATPTRLGKEIGVFVERIEEQYAQLRRIPFSAKFGGATGNFNAHKAAYPKTNWKSFANSFVDKKLGLKRSQLTTQIEHYDNLSALFDCLKRINTIFLDLDRDMWTYISMDYFKQKIKEGEIGSSAMPHKVNPIDFENSEGNIGLANAMLEHLSAKLPVSRLQRDLTDSTVLRNAGMPFAYSLIAWNSLLKGLNKIILNKPALDADLDNNWAVVAEAIQTILRREGYPKPYEALKALTRKNEKITKKTIHEFIENLEVAKDIKAELKKISPFNYTGI